MGHWGTCPFDFQQFRFSSLWNKSDSPTIQVLCSLRDQLMQMSTTHCSFDLAICISHKTISHQAHAAPGREVHRECPVT